MLSPAALRISAQLASRNSDRIAQLDGAGAEAGDDGGGDPRRELRRVG
jgi:hypothetical protein